MMKRVNHIWEQATELVQPLSCAKHVAHSRQQCHNNSVTTQNKWFLQEKLLKVLKCYNFLWVQRRHNCSPAASFANCVDTLPVEIKWNANLMQLGNFMLSCSIWFSAPSFWMGGGLERRCVGRVYGADVAVWLHRKRDLRSGSQDHHPPKNSVQKIICCNSTSNAPDDRCM